MNINPLPSQTSVHVPQVTETKKINIAYMLYTARV